MKESWLLVALVLVVAGACVDPPITSLEGGGHARPPPLEEDAATDAPEDLLTGCKRCMNADEDPGPGCYSAYTTCVNDKKCNDTLECIYGAGCFGASPKSFLGCGTPCGTKAGIFTGNDPSLAIAAALFQCVANGGCNAACFTADSLRP